MGGSRAPSLGLVNLLEQLIELRETLHLLDRQLIMKGWNSEQPDGREAEGDVCGKAEELLCPLCAHHWPSQHLCVPTHLESSPNLPFWVFMEVSSHRHD